MDLTTLVILTLVLFTLAGLVIAYLEFRRSKRLRDTFGPEYAWLVEETGDKRAAEAALTERMKRVKQFPLRALTEEEKVRFARIWEDEQARFVNDPPQAVANADRLVENVMEARGYPVGDFDQRAADISVDHPQVVKSYRLAHEIVLRDQRERVSTEDLRRVMVLYRELVADLLEIKTAERVGA
jgi:hypothetical protein